MSSEVWRTVDSTFRRKLVPPYFTLNSAEKRSSRHLGNKPRHYTALYIRRQHFSHSSVAYFWLSIVYKPCAYSLNNGDLSLNIGKKDASGKQPSCILEFKHEYVGLICLQLRVRPFVSTFIPFPFLLLTLILSASGQYWPCLRLNPGHYKCIIQFSRNCRHSSCCYFSHVVGPNGYK
jgi:hypothetical protein